MSSSAQRAVAAKDQGNTHFTAGRYEEALLKYKEAISLDNTQVVFYSNASQCLLNLKKYPEAIEYATSALKLDQTHVKSLVRRASALRSLSRIADASYDLQAAHDLEPTNKSIVMELSALITALTLEAHAEFATSSASSPNSKPFKSPALAEAHYSLINLVPDVPQPAQSFGDFEVHWRPLRDYPELMNQYLTQFDPLKIPSIFKDLMTTEMLQSWLETALILIQSPSTPTSPNPVTILEKLASLPRFHLMIMFLTPEQTSLVKEVFTALKEKAIDVGSLESKFL